MITETQRQQRRKYIGSSDCPAILGLIPDRSAYDVYLEKTGRLEPAEPTDAMDFGTRMESVILDWAERHTACTISRNLMLTAGNRCANLDGCVRRVGVLAEIFEAKATRLWQTWGDEDTDQIPPRVAAQCLHQAGVVGPSVTKIWIPMVTLGLSFKMFQIEMTPENCAARDEIAEEMERFWEKHVKADVPPDSAPTLAVVKRIIRIPKKLAVATDDGMALRDEWQAAREARLAAEKKEDELQARMIASLGDAEAAAFPDGRLLTYFETERAGYTVQPTKYRSPKLLTAKKSEQLLSEFKLAQLPA